MKIDRRSFLSFVVGGAAGTALSPLPWKLTDDLSIWTQKWPWTPVPADGRATYVNTVCTLCDGGCGITVRRIDERAVGIAGHDGYPGSNGGVCPLGLAGLQLVYGPRRVTRPLKRSGPRGSGHWTPIGWEQALQEVAGRLSEMRAKGQPHSLGCISGSAHGTVPALLQRFLTAFGSPNFMTTPSIQDAYAQAFARMHGQADAVAGFDLEHTDYVLSFGSGIIDGWGGPVRMIQAHSRWQANHCPVVQIEPRLSNTAAKAHRWLAVTPGSEADLALALACVIVNEKLYHREFVARRTSGFEALNQSVLQRHRPERVAGLTGLSAEAITALARDFAGADRPIALCGRGRGDVPGGLREILAVHTLNALVGSLNAPGGVWVMPRPDAYIQWPAPALDRLAQDGLERHRLDGAGQPPYATARSLLNRLPGVVAAGQDYPLEALFVADANPCYTLGDTATVRAAVEQIPFIVSVTAYMDETAQVADLVLPQPTYLERGQDVPVTGLPRPTVGLAVPVVAPQGDTRHPGDVVIQLARRIGGPVGDAFGWPSYAACFEATLAPLEGQLRRRGYWQDEAFRPAEGPRAVATASGRIEFADPRTLAALTAPAPALEGDATAFPLTLVPYDSLRLAAGAVGTPPFGVKTVDDTVLIGNDVRVQINPATAASLGLRDNRTARLSTPKGHARVRVHLDDGVMPGLVAMPRGLGHTGTDPYLAGKGVNVNQLIGNLEDPASGLNAAWGIRAALAKA